ncbi:MAG: hypothetical protein Q7T41_01255 [Candidatus Saccharibacteria bacterium]|nr:hypothetical protein [Candidatus Saccharibacteria bacterium]
MSLLDRYQVHQQIKTVIKIYPGIIRLYKFSTPFMVRRFDYDPYNPNRKRKSGNIDEEESERKSLKRSKSNLIDICLCNGFDLFVTFTFKDNRRDIEAKRQQMAFWLNNQRILHGPFKYAIVMELHKDGAPHFHALFAEYKGKLKKSGRSDDAGRKIYNIKSYRGGFTTAVKIDNIEKTSAYIAKYITKDMPRLRNKQRYWCSNGLKKPLKIVNPLLTESDLKLFNSSFKKKNMEIFDYRGEMSDMTLARISDFGRQRVDDLIVSEW